MTESLFAEASQRLDAALHHISISEDAITYGRLRQRTPQIPKV